ncbi:Uncharacterised protein [Mycobacteroides abscessus subsp. abscessus]|nr:Uncharacterised protein [Mycobacteroides abscessus subsp. abscessus]SKT09364.1 Uncharacterised protein [Mycobacteroides abscessus subsp. abscessus]
MALRSEPLCVKLADTDATGLWSYIGSSDLRGDDFVKPGLSIQFAIEGPGVLLPLVVDVAGQPAAPLSGTY